MTGKKPAFKILHFQFSFLLFSFFFFHSSFLFALSLDETINNLRLAEGSAGKQAEFRWDPFFQAGVFSLGSHSITFLAGSGPGETGYLLLNGSEIFTTALPFPDNGELFFPEAFSINLQNAFSHAIREEASRFRIAAIIIDPGHGGKDPGASSDGEFTINGKTFKAN